MQYTNQRKTDSSVYRICKSRMKHSIKYILMVLLCISLSACGNKEATTETTIETNLTVEEMLAVVLGSQELPDYYGLEAFIPGDRGYENYLASNLEQVSEDVEDGVICISSDMEISIFLMKDEESAKESEDLLLAYQESRVNTFTGYAPEMAARAEQGKIVVNGRYIALFICFDTDKAQEAFLSCFEDTSPEIPEEYLLNRETSEDVVPGGTEITTEETSVSEEGPTEETASDTDGESVNDVSDVYDHDAVLLAWETGDASNLSEKNLAVLRVCETVIRYEISDDMTEYEKELAIHDWMLDWGSYDRAHLSAATMDQCNPDNDNPYGFLLGKKGICLGYATTFQLFMDMLQIECITVEGYARVTEDHAWNQVRLDGEWYCVDVTWDDPTITTGTISKKTAHLFFNVTSNFMRGQNHQWNADEVEEAEGTTYSWKPDR